VGLVLGLLRDDTAFIGYEFVAHRVEVSNAAARALALAGRIGYQTKDLADPAFQIPEADAYYLYDPFCRETYQRVFARLIEIGRKRPIAVVMKGNGTPGFEFAIKDEAWLSPVRVDQGTAAIFRSAPSMRSSTVASS
jgi:hypothetical protein